MIKDVFAIITLVSLLGCSSPTEPPITVRYEISGAATTTANVTYINSTSGRKSNSDITLPWEFELSVPPGTFVSVSAQNTNSAGTITVKIYRDGKLFRESVNIGAYVTAESSGNV